ncbi:amidohydrolase family protein [Collimonas fungivorans]|nr:amidohydrolase family protein [Collimonas fungivorans]
MNYQVLPEDACDCHMHLFDSSYSVIPNASLRPPPASLVDYQQIQNAIGSRRFVIVQPSIYGLDNSLLLQSLREVGTHRARGVAVVNGNITESVLSGLYLNGVRGVRFNQVQNGVTSMDMLEKLDKRMHERGMHIQFHARPDLFIEAESRLLSLRSNVVIDHIGRLASQPDVREKTEATIYRLLDSEKVWMKLSAPYLASAQDAPYSDISEFVGGLIRHFSHRLVWGTDWPHVTEAAKQDDQEMLRFFTDLMPSDDVAQKIFVGNSEELYGFPRST